MLAMFFFSLFLCVSLIVHKTVKHVKPQIMNFVKKKRNKVYKRDEEGLLKIPKEVICHKALFRVQRRRGLKQKSRYILLNFITNDEQINKRWSSIKKELHNVSRSSRGEKGGHRNW